MINSAEWASVLSDSGYRLAAGVPCSSLSALQSHFQTASLITYVAAPNEGQAVAVASGSVMAGRRAVVLMQNSGLGNAVNPLTSLVETFKLPLVLVISWRGQPGQSDEPQHFRMGLSTHTILDAINIPHVTLKSERAEATRQLRWAIESAERERRCVAIVVPDGTFEPTQPTTEVPVARPSSAPDVHKELTRKGDVPSRTEVLCWLRTWAGSETIRIATTGKTGRELFSLSDDPSNLYVVGSMGLASSVGLGMSLTLPRRTLVIDGDGAVLMHLGALPMIARYGGDNLLHIVVDNGSYDSTGGQRTIAPHAPFAEIAARCGYTSAACVNSIDGLGGAMAVTGKGPSLIHMLVRPGSPPTLPRPTLAPHETLKRLQDHFSIRP